MNAPAPLFSSSPYSPITGIHEKLPSAKGKLSTLPLGRTFQPGPLRCVGGVAAAFEGSDSTPANGHAELGAVAVSGSCAAAFRLLLLLLVPKHSAGALAGTSDLVPPRMLQEDE
jgi:hypothetical protein